MKSSLSELNEPKINPKRECNKRFPNDIQQKTGQIFERGSHGEGGTKWLRA